MVVSLMTMPLSPFGRSGFVSIFSKVFAEIVRFVGPVGCSTTSFGTPQAPAPIVCPVVG